METRINIAEILRNKPSGIKLYSPIFGNCTYCYIHDETSDICVRRPYNEMSYFNFEGLYNTAGECLLFPSKEMRDWSKFAWKNGDVLVNSSGFKLLFDRWANDDYTRFFGKFNILEDSFSYETEKYTLVSKDETIDTFEIEKPEFKDGDIIKMTWDKYSAIAIFWKYSNFGKGFNSHVFFNIKTKIIEYNIHGHTLQDMILRLATEEEKQQLFSSLANKGKAWDSEKKEVVDLKPKCEFKPFDKVVVFDELAKKWECGMFSHYSKNYEGKEVITCIGGCTYFKVLPFNEETAKLIGTTNNVED